jgi:hypothetical protein
MATLIIKHDTIFKNIPDLSSKIPKDPKYQQTVKAGQRLEIKTWTQAAHNHYKVELSHPLNGLFDWFIYADDVQIESNSVKLKVPYKQQLDNYNNPYGSCNVTSLAMCFQFKGVMGNGNGQLEDQLYEYMESSGLSRHSPNDLALVAGHYGVKDSFTEFGTIERCQEHLSNGNPCIVHGWFTQSGHIIVLVGYDENGFIVHDPYGEWHSDGYDTSASGEYLHYSYKMIRELCFEGETFWVHYIG